MPIKRAAYKQIRADRKKAFKNASGISAIKTAVKKVNKIISSKNKDKIKSALRDFSSVVSKVAQKGIIHKKKGSRIISRMSKKAASLLK